MSACTQAKKKLSDAEVKRQRTASSNTGGSAASSDTVGSAASDTGKIQELKFEVKELQQKLTNLTEALGEGKDAKGKWVATLGPRGLTARCALAALSARGKIPNPCQESASRVAQGNCVHQASKGECLVCEHLAYCYYCFQPLCPEHRILIGESKVHMVIWHILYRLGFWSPMILVEFR